MENNYKPRRYNGSSNDDDSRYTIRTTSPVRLLGKLPSSYGDEAGQEYGVQEIRGRGERYRVESGPGKGKFIKSPVRVSPGIRRSPSEKVHYMGILPNGEEYGTEKISDRGTRCRVMSGPGNGQFVHCPKDETRRSPGVRRSPSPNVKFEGYIDGNPYGKEEIMGRGPRCRYLPGSTINGEEVGGKFVSCPRK